MNRPELEQRWREGLQQLQLPDGFQEQLHQNLSWQLRVQAKTRARQRSVWSRVFASAAVLLTIGVLVIHPFSAPPLIAAAHAHAAEERHSGDIDLTYAMWLMEGGLRSVPRESRVVLAKNCVVADRPAQHLRVTMAGSAYADLFIIKTNDQAAGVTRGTYEGRSWWQWQPQAGHMVTVLFDAAIADGQQRQWTQQLAQG